MTKIGDGAQIHVTENRSQATLYRCEFSEGFFFRLCSWFWFWFLTEETLLSRRAPIKEALPNPTDQRLPVLILTPPAQNQIRASSPATYSHFGSARLLNGLLSKGLL